MADDSGRLNQVFAETSFLYGTNAIFIEQMQERWAQDPNSVSPEWRAFFDSLMDRPEAVSANAAVGGWAQPGRCAARRTDLGDGRRLAGRAGQGRKGHRRQDARAPSPADLQSASRNSIRALMLIRAYRMRGHLQANLDPLGIEPPIDNPELTPDYWGFTDADMDRPIFLDGVLGLETGHPPRNHRRSCAAPTAAISASSTCTSPIRPKRPGCRSASRAATRKSAFTKEGKIAILKKLIEAEGFERFLHRRFPGTKRFGLDGGEAMVPALEQIIKRGGALGVKEIIFGMAHRGRLNTLAAVMGKPYRAIFHEFQGGSTLPSDIEGSGDVKYHMGASSDREFDGNNVHLSLTANPSHLEIVNPVVLGKARAKQAFDIKNAGTGCRKRPDRGKAMRPADPRRRRLRRPGRRHGMFRPDGAEGLPHRRHDAFRHQQPDRLHHRAALLALVALSVGRGPDGPGADLPL